MCTQVSLKENEIEMVRCHLGEVKSACITLTDLIESKEKRLEGLRAENDLKRYLNRRAEVAQNALASYSNLTQPMSQRHQREAETERRFWENVKMEELSHREKEMELEQIKEQLNRFETEKRATEHHLHQILEALEKPMKEETKTLTSMERYGVVSKNELSRRRNHHSREILASIEGKLRSLRHPASIGALVDMIEFAQLYGMTVKIPRPETSIKTKRTTLHFEKIQFDENREWRRDAQGDRMKHLILNVVQGQYTEAEWMELKKFAEETDESNGFLENFEIFVRSLKDADVWSLMDELLSGPEPLFVDTEGKLHHSAGAPRVGHFKKDETALIQFADLSRVGPNCLGRVLILRIHDGSDEELQKLQNKLHLIAAQRGLASFNDKTVLGVPCTRDIQKEIMEEFDLKQKPGLMAEMNQSRFRVGMRKNETLSNWTAMRLRSSQIEYAALDAIAPPHSLATSTTIIDSAASPTHRTTRPTFQPTPLPQPSLKIPQQSGFPILQQLDHNTVKKKNRYNFS